MPQRVSAARSELKATQQRVLDALGHDGTPRSSRAGSTRRSRESAAHRLPTTSPSSSPPGSSSGSEAAAARGIASCARSATASGAGPTIGSAPRSSSSATAATRGRRRASSRRRATPTSTWRPAGTEGSASGRTSSASRGPRPRLCRRPLRPRTREPRRRWRPKIGWAAGAVAFAAALFAAGGASFYAWHGQLARRRTASHRHDPRAPHAGPLSAARVCRRRPRRIASIALLSARRTRKGRARRPNRLGASKPAGLVHPSR